VVGRADEASADALSEPEDRCWLCKRPLGRKVQRHHPVPKSRGGRETVPVHPICHKAIHANFTNAQLSRIEGREPLLAKEAVARFVSWVADKPADFHAPTRTRR
jgi:hypothetical protein